MREILFRAYDQELGLSEPFSLNYYPIWNGETKPYWANLCKIEQFTGLTDKNGTKIFEGDVVECHAIETTEVVIVEDIRNIPVHFKWGDIYKGSTIEIIGNIHDNPELFEEKTC